MSLQMQSSYNKDLEQWELKAKGEVDISTAPQLREYLDGAYQEIKADILLHLDELNYIDSTGLGVIIGAFGRMQETDNRITLIQPERQYQKTTQHYQS